jgi:hypothetical protein
VKCVCDFGIGRAECDEIEHLELSTVHAVLSCRTTGTTPTTTEANDSE